MKHDGAEWSRVEWNIDLTRLFGYFIKNVSFYHIHPKLDGAKNVDFDGIGWNGFYHISFHPLFANPNNRISLIITPLQ